MINYQTTIVEYQILLETIRFETIKLLWAMPGPSGYHLLSNIFLDITKDTMSE